MKQRRVGAPIGRIVAFALVGTAVAAGVMLRLNLDVDHNVVTLIAPGAQSQAAPVLHHDFPDYTLRPGVGHDGQTFYVIAREPMHYADAAQHVDRPRYRFQRILLPVLAWAVHPQGGGTGLVLALWIWAVIGVALTGIGGALLASALGASRQNVELVALLGPLLPVSFSTLDLTVADTLALGLVVTALAFDALGYRRSALATAILAVLAKEVVLLVLLGWILRRGRRGSIRLFTIPLAVVGAWWIALRFMFPHDNGHSDEFDPVHGITKAISVWFDGRSMVAAFATVTAIVLALVVLFRDRLRSPLSIAIVLQLVFIPMLGPIVLANDWNGPRASAALFLLSVIAIFTPRNARVPSDEPDEPDAVSSLHAAPA